MYEVKKNIKNVITSIRGADTRCKGTTIMANFDAFFDVIEHSKTRIKRTNVRKKIQNHHIQ